jgi:ABC-type Fe3+/spermidine/putrescine transport system ATPase subunit
MDDPSKDWPSSKMFSIFLTIDCKVFYDTIDISELEPDEFDGLFMNLFDNIAPTYDLLNHLLSLGRDLYWRKMAVQQLKGLEGWILDIATGTGDVAIEMIRQNSQHRKVFGLDFSKPMIKRAHRKVLGKGLSPIITLSLGDALSLPFRDSTFSASMIAFGLRIHKAPAKHMLDEIIEQSLMQVDLWDQLKDRLHKSAFTLSLEQRQRLCIARLAAVKPEVLLMDEPTEGLAPLLKKEVRDMLESISKTGVSILLVEHNFKIALSLAKHVYVMKKACWALPAR